MFGGHRNLLCQIMKSRNQISRVYRLSILSKQENGIIQSHNIKYRSQQCVMTGCEQFGGKRGGGERMLVPSIWIQDKRYFPWVVIGAVGLIYCSNGSWKNEEERKFMDSVRNDNIKNMMKFLSRIEVNCRHPLGWTAIHVAVINGNLSILKELIKAGADVNIKDEFSSARRMASQRRVLPSQVAQLRDDEFCSWINHNVSYSGFTPLHYSIIRNDKDIIEYLLENGADPTVENNAGRTPIDYCNDKIIRKLLLEYTDKISLKKAQEELKERCKFPLEDRLRLNIVGQEGPITAVAAAIRRKEMGWGDNEHPLVFLFLGSSGIGKTELAKQVAGYVHKDNPKGFIRLDMSEYQEKHEVAKLIGAPPGYIGFDQGGQLTSRLRECPNAVVLFDEVDKAHSDILTVLLQLFDEGRLTDGQGNTIHCKDAIFVMTSNLANDEIANHALQLRRDAKRATKIYQKTQNNENIEISKEFKDNVVEPILKRHFHRDEFLGRINEMVYFLPFSRSELNKLVKQEMDIWSKRVST